MPFEDAQSIDGRSEETYRFKPFALDPVRGVLYRDGDPVRLPGKSFEVLKHLVVNLNRLVGKDELMRAVWPDTFVEEANLTVHISNLRREFAKHTDSVRIETFPKVGYQLIWKCSAAHTQLPSPTLSSKAEDHLLKAKELLRSSGRRNFHKALENIQHAVKLAPGSAIVHATLAQAYLQLSRADAMAPDTAIPAAKAAARSAFELEPNLAEAHLQEGIINFHEWKWRESELSFTRAIELRPDLAEARRQYILLLCVLARYEEALEQCHIGKSMDPLHLKLAHAEGMIHYFARNYDCSIDLMRRAVAEFPDTFARFYLACAYEATGDLVAAENEMRKHLELDPRDADAPWHYAGLLARAGKKIRARGVMHSMPEKFDYFSRVTMSLAYLGFGDSENAIAHIEDGYNNRDPQISSLVLYPQFDLLRSDERFVAILRSSGLIGEARPE